MPVWVDRHDRVYEWWVAIPFDEKQQWINATRLEVEAYQVAKALMDNGE